MPDPAVSAWNKEEKRLKKKRDSEEEASCLTGI